MKPDNKAIDFGAVRSVWVSRELIEIPADPQAVRAALDHARAQLEAASGNRRVYSAAPTPPAPSHG